MNWAVEIPVKVCWVFRSRVSYSIASCDISQCFLSLRSWGGHDLHMTHPVHGCQFDTPALDRFEVSSYIRIFSSSKYSVLNRQHCLFGLNVSSRFASHKAIHWLVSAVKANILINAELNSSIELKCYYYMSVQSSLQKEVYPYIVTD